MFNQVHQEKSRSYLALAMFNLAFGRLQHVRQITFRRRKAFEIFLLN